MFICLGNSKVHGYVYASILTKELRKIPHKVVAILVEVVSLL